MKKILLTLFIFSGFFASAQTYNIPDTKGVVHVTKVFSSTDSAKIKANTDSIQALKDNAITFDPASKSDTMRVTQSADYVIEKVGATIYARPAYKSTLPAYSGSVLSTVLNSCMSNFVNGGTIEIKYAIYDNMGQVLIPYSNITLRSSDNPKPVLKLIDGWDIGKTPADNGGFITISAYIGAINNITIEGLEIDGNSANQTYKDDGSKPNGIGTVAVSSAIFINSETGTCDGLVVSNCYIHDVAKYGIISFSLNTLVTNNVIDNCYWNGITLMANNSIAKDNYVNGSGDVGITVYGSDCSVINNTIGNQDGVYGSGNSRGGIAIEGSGSERPSNIRISGNKISGPDTKNGIGSGSNGRNNIIDNNAIFNVSETGIQMILDSGSVISNNKVIEWSGESSRGFYSSGSQYMSVINNTITSSTGAAAISFDAAAGAYSTNNIISGNILGAKNQFGINIQSDDVDNIIANNIITTKNNDFNSGVLPLDIATVNTFTNNYEFGKSSNGKTTLASGTKVIAANGVNTSSKVSVTLVSIGGTVTTTWQYAAVCTANTITITALTNTGATNTSDTSTLNYFIEY